jgi:hypothetical protein
MPTIGNASKLEVEVVYVGVSASPQIVWSWAYEPPERRRRNAVNRNAFIFGYSVIVGLESLPLMSNAMLAEGSSRSCPSGKKHLTLG